MQETRETGFIGRYIGERGFGFIVRDTGPDLFFHIKKVHLPEGMNEDAIRAGVPVEFDVIDAPGGQRAVDVVLLEALPPAA